MLRHGSQFPPLNTRYDPTVHMVSWPVALWPKHTRNGIYKKQHYWLRNTTSVGKHQKSSNMHTNTFHATLSSILQYHSPNHGLQDFLGFGILPIFVFPIGSLLAPYRPSKVYILLPNKNKCTVSKQQQCLVSNTECLVP